jgi:hypothetical protein
VYYHPNVAANVISFFNLTKRFASVVYDNKIRDAFTVTRDDGTMLDFIPSDDGLYYYDFNQSVRRKVESIQERTMVVTTIEEIKRKFSKREKQLQTKQEDSM